MTFVILLKQLVSRVKIRDSVRLSVGIDICLSSVTMTKLCGIKYEVTCVSVCRWVTADCRRIVCDVMNTRELTACLAILMFALLATVHIQLFAVFYVSNDTNGKSFVVVVSLTKLWQL